MSKKDLIDQLGKLSERELFIEVTIRYLYSLPPQLTDAAFRGAILRWFNPETLQGILGVGKLSGLEDLEPSKDLTLDELYDELRNLRFAEEYPGRGYSFHDLTREHILSHLWDKEPDFYHQVSDQASEYFADLFEAQLVQSEDSEGDLDQVDWELGVEVAYHSIIANEQESIVDIDDFLVFMAQQYLMGTYHAILEAISEHAEAGRLSPDSQAVLKVWRLRELLANYDLVELERQTTEILAAPEPSTPSWLKAEASYTFARGLNLASRYDEAERYLKQNIEQHVALEDASGVVRGLKELGMLELYRDNIEPAEENLAEALSLHVQLLRLPADEESEFGDDTPLLVFTPEAWHRQELYLSEEELVPEEEPPSTNGKEELPQVVVLYFIQFDLESLGIDPPEVSEEEVLQYMWPVDFDADLAELWLDFAYLCRADDRYDLAAACARLAGQMYTDLDDLIGTQSAVQVLKGLGANIGDLEYVKILEDIEYELISVAVTREDKGAQLSGLINQAASQFEKEMFEEAGNTYEEAYALAVSLNLTNEKATCLDGLAKISWTWGEYDQAIERFNKSLELYEQVHNREGWADSLLSLGDLYLSINQFAEAEQQYLRALDTYDQLRNISGRSAALLRLSDAAIMKGDYGDSFKYLDQVLEMSRSTEDKRLSSQAVALSRIALLHQSLGNTEEAEEIYDEALSISDQILNQQLSKDILLDKASELSRMAKYESAVRVYEEVIDYDPNYLPAYTGLAWALESIGKEKASDARRAYEKASELQPKDWWIHKGIANALRLGGDKEAAAKKYRWVTDQIEEEGAQNIYRSTLAWCWYQLGEYEKAEKIYRIVIKKEPDSISDYFDLGLILLCRENYAEALDLYRQGIELLQQRYPPSRRLGLIDVAIVDLQEAAEVIPELLVVKEGDRIRELLAEQQRLAHKKPD